MSAFGFFSSKKARPSTTAASGTSQEAPVSLAGSETVTARIQALRNKIHAHLLSSSRDYAVLASLRASKIEYCEKVSRDVTRRLASNPFFEVLQHLDKAQLELQKATTAGR